MKAEKITLNDEQGNTTDVPDHMQNVLTDKNGNGIPDNMEVQTPSLGISNLKAEIKAQSQRLEQEEFNQAPRVIDVTEEIESSAGKILKAYITSAKYYLAASAFIALLMYAMLYILGSVS